MINIDDFLKLDIRIGTILEAEKIPDADKLLRLIIDLGTEGENAIGKRQIMAGIAESFTPEELIGRQLPVIVNLEPRILRGFESQGMILATGDDLGIALLHPSKEVPNGSKVR